MRRSPTATGFSASGLLGILVLVALVAGVPIVVKQAHDAGHRLADLVGARMTTQAQIGA